MLIAVLLLTPRERALPLIAAFGIGVTAANLAFGDPLPLATLLAAVNIVEALLATALLRWRCGDTLPDFGRLPKLACFFMAAILIAPAVGASLGASVLMVHADAPFASVLATWFLADALGNATVAPLTIMAARAWQERSSTTLRLHTFWPVATLLALSGVVFGQTQAPIAFLIYPAALLCTLRLGEIGAALAIVVVAVVGGPATVLGSGPMALAASTGWHIALFQLLLASLLASCLPLAALLAQRRQLTAALAEQAACLADLIEQIDEVVYTTNATGRWTSLNPAWERMTGHPSDESVGQSFLSLIHPDDRQRALESMQTIIQGERQSARATCRFFTRLGLRDIQVLVHPIMAEGEITGFHGTMQDVTDRTRLEDGLRRAASLDALTGIPNRRAFDDVLARLVDPVANVKVALAIIDIDHFKRVNDRFGHAAGDEALREVARRLEASLRQSDFCARLGGEEFVALLPGSSMAEARAVCERLRTAIEAGDPTGQGSMPAVTISIGLAAARPRESGAELLARADQALYAAKAAGRNRVQLAA